MSHRRTFLKQAALAGAGLSLSGLYTPLLAAAGEQHLERLEGLPPDDVARDEDFWGWVREQYTTSSTLINLNNGGVSPQPRPVQEAHIRQYQYANEAPTYTMWRIMDGGREPLRKKLALLAGADPDEVAINRNATEGLNTIIFGLDLQRGDEVVLSKYDYPNMMNAWKQRAKRDGVVLRWVDLPQFPMENSTEIVARYEAQMTEKTKVVHITHIINWTGQILPVRAIADAAHAAGAEVIVDGAHSFAHLDFKIPDLGADYFATSLHKWLCAPFGSGMLWIKKQKIPKVWALLSAPEPDGKDIRKFENLGTRSFASEMAIAAAIDFHNIIGIKRKEARLRYLKNYWAKQAVAIPKVRLHTSLKAAWSGALAFLSIDGRTGSEVESRLLEKWKIHTSPMKYEALDGVRITPHLYTMTADLDLLVQALTEIASGK